MSDEQKTNEKKLYLKCSDSDEFPTFFVCEIHEAQRQMEYLTEQFYDVMEGDEGTLCFKAVEMTESEFKKAQDEFQGF